MSQRPPPKGLHIIPVKTDAVLACWMLNSIFVSLGGSRNFPVQKVTAVWAARKRTRDGHGGPMDPKIKDESFFSFSKMNS